MRLKAGNEPTGLLLGIHTLAQAWSGQECDAILAAIGVSAAAGRGWQTSRHAAYATTDLPASHLPAEQYAALQAAIAGRIFPAMREKYGLPTGAAFRFRDLFLVKYEVEGEKNAAAEVEAAGLRIGPQLYGTPKFGARDRYFQ